jgi:hypothetical protein
VVLKKSKNRFGPLIMLLKKSKNQVKELTLNSWFFDKVFIKTNDLDNTGIFYPHFPNGLPSWKQKNAFGSFLSKLSWGCSKLHSRSWSPNQEHNQTIKSFIDDVDNIINLWTPPNTDANATAEII